jgi:Uma2 family endonuclease
MATTIFWEATVDDLARVEGKAELVDGKIHEMSPSGFLHSRIAMRILFSLAKYEDTTKSGFAFGDGGGFLCDLPHRKSFSPDAGYYDGALPQNSSDFLPEPPKFAVEIRSKSDYGPAAESTLASKRADYFAAGTRAVWDVDAEGPAIVRLYLASNAESPVEFRRGEIAHAEPVLPGWRLPVNDILKELDLK